MLWYRVLMAKAKKIKEFDKFSLGQRCFLSNLPKQGGRAEGQSVKDEFLVRLGEAQQRGFVDVRPAALLEAAVKFAGAVPEKDMEAVEEKYHMATALLEEAKVDIADLEEALAAALALLGSRLVPAVAEADEDE